MIAAPPPVALTASPVRIALAGAARETIRVANPGRLLVVVDAAPAGFALDLRGRPRVVVRRDASVRVTVSPGRVTLPPGGAASLVVSSSVGPHARAGDHEALVLLTTHPSARGGVAVRMQVGVVVTVRVAGALVHRLELLALRADRRGKRALLDLSVRNRGNVAEEVGPASLRVELRRRGRPFATLRAVRRRFLPGARGVAEFRGPGGLRGRVTAVVTLSGPAAGGPVVRRAFRIRLGREEEREAGQKHLRARRLLARDRRELALDVTDDAARPLQRVRAARRGRPFVNGLEPQQRQAPDRRRHADERRAERRAGGRR